MTAPTDFFDVIAAERPVPTPPAAASTARARSALLEHIATDRATVAALAPVLAPVVAPATAGRSASPRRRRRARTVAVAAGVTAAAVALVLAIGPGFGLGFGGSSDEAVAAPLAKLAALVVQSTPAPGNATLIRRTQSYPDGTSTEGFDLYLDDGTYFYADTVDGLPAALASPDGGNGFVARDEAAALAALDLDAATARQRMAVAALDPALAAMTPEQRAATAQPEIDAKKVAGPTPPTTMSPEAHEDGDVWSNSLDALTAGASRPDVRAGVLKLLATIKAASVTDVVDDSGRAELHVAASVFGDDYREELVLDAATGMPIRLVGGYPGHAPSVIVTYGVSRVDTSDLGGLG